MTRATTFDPEASAFSAWSFSSVSRSTPSPENERKENRNRTSWLSFSIGDRNVGGRENSVRQQMPKKLSMQSAAAIALEADNFAVCELRGEAPTEDLSPRFERHDAYLICVMCRDFSGYRSWEGRENFSARDLRAGETVICDLRRDPRMLFDKPVHAMYYFISRDVLDSVAAEVEAKPVGELRYERGIGVIDSTMIGFSGLIRNALENPIGANDYYLGRLAAALTMYLGSAYGRLEFKSQRSTGGLAPWQRRRVDEMLAARASSTVQQLAAACGLSVGYFARAFRRSMGISPHEWIVNQRVATAKFLIREGRMALSEIALECGFSDQSHLTRVFAREVGMNPGAWRRCVKV